MTTLDLDNGYGDFDQLVAYAWHRVFVSHRIARRHQHVYTYCSCGRPWPCPQETSVALRRSTYEDALGSLVGPTVLVPVVELSSPAPVLGRWRWFRRLPDSREA